MQERNDRVVGVRANPHRFGTEARRSPRRQLFSFGAERVSRGPEYSLRHAEVESRVDRILDLIEGELASLLEEEVRQLRQEAQRRDQERSRVVGDQYR